MAIELKPCSFCGGCTEEDQCYVDIIIKRRSYTASPDFQAQCGRCGATGPIASTKAEAIAAWNTRADGWQSLDGLTPDPSKAPWDGEDVLLWEPQIDCRGIGFWDKDHFRESCRDANSEMFPTHWRPLPDPPRGPDAK